MLFLFANSSTTTTIHTREQQHHRFFSRCYPTPSKTHYDGPDDVVPSYKRAAGDGSYGDINHPSIEPLFTGQQQQHCMESLNYLYPAESKVVTTEIEIDAPPALVRSMFLDFANVADWHDGSWFKKIEIRAPGKTHGSQLVPGEKILTTLQNMQIVQTVQYNGEFEFRITGAWSGILSAIQGYKFLPSEKTPGGTRLVHWEEFSGLVGWFMDPKLPGGIKTAENFQTINSQLKARAEQLAKART